MLVPSSAPAVRFGTAPETADLLSLAQHTGTPAYVLFEQVLRDRYAALRRALAAAEPVQLYYSVKSNFETGVLVTLQDIGCGAEISGAVERLAIERAGFDWKRVVFDGPVKSEDDLAYAVSHSVHLINVESEEEIEVLRRIARHTGRRVRVGVRVSPTLRAPSYSLVIRTYRDKFGFCVQDIERLAELMRRTEEIEWVGLMVHVGSPVTHAEPYLRVVEQCFAVAARLRRRGIYIEEINLGGGLPADSMVSLRISRRIRLARLWERFGRLEARTESSCTIAERIAARVVELRRRHDLPATIALEPGRTLVAGAGMMLGRVCAVRPRWIFVDISLNDLPEKLSFTERRLAFPGRSGAPLTQRRHIGGPTLSTQDVLFYDCAVPELRCGDSIAILDAGAYSVARANQFARPRPPVYFVDARGTLHLIRRAEAAADVLQTQMRTGA
jgi:diaminopimelate decarboxylase